MPGTFSGTFSTANIPETDLVPLAFQDPDSLVNAGVLQIQRIHLLPGILLRTSLDFENRQAACYGHQWKESWG